MTHLNGTDTEANIAESLQEEFTLGYKPVMPLELLWLAGAGDFPQVTLRRDLEFMQLHPVVASGLGYYKSGIAGAEFWGGPDQANPENDKGKPISPDIHVSQFVLAHCERFWQRGVPILQEAYAYGWAPGEHLYKEVNGMLVWSHLKGFHPNDGYILTLKKNPVGIRIKNIRDIVGNMEARGSQVDLWFASDHIPAKAAWYPHRPRFNQFYGRSQLIDAWRPWRRLGWRDAVEQVIDAAVYRAGYRGPIVRHPPEDMQTGQSGIPATQQDSRGMPRRSARDVARQLVEWAKAGAGFTLSSAQYPPAQGGGPKWGIEWPEHVMDVTPLIEAAKYLEDQIMLGIGVPPELVKAGGTGSGYSGRSIPREAFLDGQQRVADAMLQIFVEQVIKPLVLWNFGDIPFNVQCKPLLKTQTENKQGQPQPPLPQQPTDQQGKPGQQPPGGNPAQPTPPKPPDPNQPPPPQTAAMSLDVPDRKVMEIVRRVLTNSIPLSTDAHGHEHRGKGKGGGQFVAKVKADSVDDTTSKPKEWDGTINRNNWASRPSLADLANFDTYDSDGNHVPQVVRLVSRDYDPDPSHPDSKVITLYRWEAFDNNDDTTDNGEWTLDINQAKSDGIDHAENNHTVKFVDDDDDDDDDSFDPVQELLDGDESNALALTGAPKGATERHHIKADGESISIVVEHPHISFCERTLHVDDKGVKFIHNEYLRVNSGAPAGFGSAMFAAQVEAAREAGYGYIETHAAGSWKDRKSFNGYYTWAALGYDQPIDKLDRSTRIAAERAFPNAKSVLDIMATPSVTLPDDEAEEVRRRCGIVDQERGKPIKDRTIITGKDWWLAFGSDMEHAVFSLDKNSRSSKVNNEYERKKGK